MEWRSSPVDSPDRPKTPRRARTTDELPLLPPRTCATVANGFANSQPNLGSLTRDPQPDSQEQVVHSQVAQRNFVYALARNGLGKLKLDQSLFFDHSLRAARNARKEPISSGPATGFTASERWKRDRQVGASLRFLRTEDDVEIERFHPLRLRHSTVGKVPAPTIEYFPNLGLRSVKIVEEGQRLRAWHPRGNVDDREADAHSQ